MFLYFPFRENIITHHTSPSYGHNVHNLQIHIHILLCETNGASSMTFFFAFTWHYTKQRPKICLCTLAASPLQISTLQIALIPQPKFTQASKQSKPSILLYQTTFQPLDQFKPLAMLHMIVSQQAINANQAEQ